jgi:hypothetical protein
MDKPSVVVKRALLEFTWKTTTIGQPTTRAKLFDLNVTL